MMLRYNDNGDFSNEEYLRSHHNEFSIFGIFLFAKYLSRRQISI